jgi:hypothetical protein
VADLSRYADWTSWLAARAAEDDDILVVWVGGSAATGGYDEWSDLDVEVFCRGGSGVAVHDRLLSRAHADFTIHDVWRLPAGTYPDGAQSFINLQTRPGLLEEPTRLIDIVVRDLSEEHGHVDVRRHGAPIVLHDPGCLVVLRDDDQAAMDASIAAALDQVRQRRVTGEWLVNRAIRRDHPAEALDLYLRFALGPVVRLLRVQHCPWRHDYGLRYLREDLPPEIADRVESLVPGHGPGDLAAMSSACFAWYDELLTS